MSPPLLAAIAGGVALVACLAGAILDPAGFFPAWLAAVACWIALPLGSLMLLLAHVLTGGRWGEAARPMLLAGIATLPVLALAFLPLLLGLQHLYPWARGNETPYLAPGFWSLRAVACFALWGGLALLALRRPVTRRLAALGLILLGLTTTMAAIDWLMSLEAPWSSSVFGLLVIAGALLAALAFATLLVALLGRDDEPDREARADLGSLLLAGLLLWAYLQAMQLVIIWEENLPDEIGWYLHRLGHGWQWAAGLVPILGFAAPFLLLLSRRIKRRRLWLIAICLVLLASHVVEAWWLVLAPFPAGLGALAPAAMLAIGGLVVALILHRLAPAEIAAELRAHHG
jgi:hypothetical protein